MARTLEPKRILCIKLKHIGDVILMTPAIRALRRAWPGSAISALVPRATEEVLAGNPDLTAILTFDREAGIGGSWRTLRRSPALRAGPGPGDGAGRSGGGARLALGGTPAGGLRARTVRRVAACAPHACGTLERGAACRRDEPGSRAGLRDRRRCQPACPARPAGDAGADVGAPRLRGTSAW